MVDRLRALRSVVVCSLLITTCIASAGCSITPEWRRIAARADLTVGWQEGSSFRHRVLTNHIGGSHLHIYIEGDGEPWVRGRRVAVDPTPSNPVMLRLMSETKHPGIYLGRPCFFGARDDEGCEQRLWTFSRYSPRIVLSMCKAANSLATELRAETVHLLGFSGGGTIAVLMSECTDRVIAVTTVAGNLDPNAWTAYHGYLPVADGNVARIASVPPIATEDHWQCRDDATVPPPITDAYFVARRDAVRHVVDDCSHDDGWYPHWSKIDQY